MNIGRIITVDHNNIKINNNENIINLGVKNLGNQIKK